MYFIPVSTDGAGIGHQIFMIELKIMLFISFSDMMHTLNCSNQTLRCLNLMMHQPIKTTKCSSDDYKHRFVEYTLPISSKFSKYHTML